MSYDRKVKDREITSDLNRLEEDVSLLQRNVGRRGYDSSSWHSDKGGEESAVEVMKRKYQEDFCRVKDQHFEEKKGLKDTISQLEAELHNLKKELHIVKSEYLVLSHTRGQGGELSEHKKNRAIQKLGAQLQNSEEQVAALQNSLVEAIEAIRKQYADNKMLVRQLEKKGVTVHTTAAAPGVLPSTEDIISDQNRKLASELESAENTIRELGVLTGLQRDDDYSTILQTLRKKLSQPDPAKVIKNLELQLQELRVNPVVDQLGDDKKSLLAQLDKSEKQLTESNQIRVLNEGEIKRQASLIEELKNQIENFKTSSRKSDDKIRDLTSRLEGMFISEQHAKSTSSNEDEVKQLTTEITVLSKQKMEGLEAIRVLTAELADTKSLKDMEIQKLQAKLTEATSNQTTAAKDQTGHIESLERTIEGKVERIGVLEDRVRELESVNENLGVQQSNTTKVLESRVSDLQQLVSTKSERIAALEQQVSSLPPSSQEELASLRTELLNSESRVKELQRDHESALSSIAQQLNGKDSECTQIQKQLQDSEKELATIQLQKEVLARKVARQDDLEAEIERLQSAQPSTKPMADNTNVEKLRAEVTNLTKSNVSLIEANVKVSTLYKERLQQIITLSSLHKESVTDLEGKVEDIRQQKESRVKTLKQQIGTLTSERNTLKKHSSELMKRFNVVE